MVRKTRLSPNQTKSMWSRKALNLFASCICKRIAPHIRLTAFFLQKLQFICRSLLLASCDPSRGLNLSCVTHRYSSWSYFVMRGHDLSCVVIAMSCATNRILTAKHDIISSPTRWRYLDEWLQYPAHSQRLTQRGSLQYLSTFCEDDGS